MSHNENKRALCHKFHMSEMLKKGKFIGKNEDTKEIDEQLLCHFGNVNANS